MQKNMPLLLLSLVLFLGSFSALAADAAFTRAEELMRQGKPAEAYSLLKPLEAENAGNVDFDYLLGIAALDSGKPDEALNAFERVLAVNPTHMGARLDMGRAFYTLGALDLSKQEFERVRAANPPEAARNVVDKYLAAIEQSTKERRRSLTGYLEGGGGYDNNITSVTSTFFAGTQQAFNQGFDPTGNGIKRRAAFLAMAGGLDFITPLTEAISFTAGFDAKQRYYDPKDAPLETRPRTVLGDAPRDNSAFNSQSLDGRVGLLLGLGKHVFGVSVKRQEYRQDLDVPLNPGEGRVTGDRNTTAVAGEWRYALSSEGQIGALVQYANNRYPTINIQDTDQTLLALSYTHSFQRPGRPVIFASVFQSEDRALRPQNPQANPLTDVSKTLKGVRLIGGYSVTERTDLSLMLGYVKREDDTAGSRSTSPTAPQFGKDDLYEVGLGVNWRFAPLWSLRGQAQYTENRSNLSLYSFRRAEYSATLRRDFR